MSDLERATKAELFTARISHDLPFKRNVVDFDVPQIDTQLTPIDRLPIRSRGPQYIRNIAHLMYNRTVDLPADTERGDVGYARSLARHVLNTPLFLVTTPQTEQLMRPDVPEFYASQIVNFVAFRKYGTSFVEPIIETASGDEALLPSHHHVLGGLYVPTDIS